MPRSDHRCAAHPSWIRRLAVAVTIAGVLPGCITAAMAVQPAGQPGAWPVQDRLPQGTILTARVDMLPHTPPGDQVYTVANGSMEGCTVRVPAAAMAHNQRPGRMDLSGATLRCPVRPTRG